MKIRTTIDLSIIALFICVSTYYAYKYLGNDNNPKDSSSITLKDEPQTVPDKTVIELITTTSAADSKASWYPQILSNRWKYIEIYQTGLLSGNTTTINKRLNKADANKATQGFHFIIGNGYGTQDGEVETSILWKTQQDSIPLLDSGKIHPNSQEDTHQTITICLIGDFTVQPPSKAQIASLKGLLNYLLAALPIKSFNIKFNRSSLPSNTSPTKLPLTQLLKSRTIN